MKTGKSQKVLLKRAIGSFPTDSYIRENGVTSLAQDCANDSRLSYMNDVIEGKLEHIDLYTKRKFSFELASQKFPNFECEYIMFDGDRYLINANDNINSVSNNGSVDSE